MSYQHKQTMKTQQHFILFGLLIAIIAFGAIANEAWAAGEGISTIAARLVEQVKSIAQLLIIVAYVSGVGFALAGIVQFKAHKDNPTQVPLSKPIVYLVIGACLLFLPTIITTAGESIFGSDKKSAGTFNSVIE